jgi:uncharacterized protein (UPF0332 family)
VRFDEKARENLEATERLLPDEDGARDGLANAAAARAYYAAYHAVADSAQQSGIPFTAGAREYYQHDRLPSDVLAWGLLDADGCDDLRLLYDRRVKADYYEDLVELEEASEALDIARDLVSRLLREEAE